MRTALLTSIALLTAAGCNRSVTRESTNGGFPTTGLQPGAPCAANSACTSLVCGVSGSGNCCAQACPSTSSLCASSGCDDAGACVYARSDTACGVVTCTETVVMEPACDGLGNCSAGSVTCPGNLGCDDAGKACLSRCATSADCATGTKCNHGFCVPPEATGPCSEADDCLSGICGVADSAVGAGHCCKLVCSKTTPPCGAMDCDGLGDCAYASAQTPCGDSACAGTLFSEAASCDGAGNCPAATTADCAPFACNVAGCPTSCSDNADCSAGLFCDQELGACCALADGGSIWADPLEGSDSVACCGTGENAPCNTIGRAMRLIDDAQAQNVTINAVFGFDGGGLWPPGSPESYPIRLGWGAELRAAAVYFGTVSDGRTPAALFDIGPYSAKDPQGSASIYSDNDYFPVSVETEALSRPPPVTIAVEPGGTLYIAEAFVDSSAKYSTTAISVAAGGKLFFERDQSDTQHGFVQLSGAFDGTDSNGYKGIVCGSDAGAGLGCTIRDLDSDGGYGLVVFEMQSYALDAEDFADVLLHNPSIGDEITTPAFGACRPIKVDPTEAAAVLLHGKANVEMDGALLTCLGTDAFDLTASSSGVPLLTLDGATIMHNGRAIDAKAGKATVTNSTIEYNYNGVEQDTDGVNVGSIDLSGGGDTVACSSVLETATGATAPGVSVLNVTAKPLDATHVAWDTSSPDVFDCDATLASCSCAASNCTGNAGADGMSAVYELPSGTIDTTGNTLSPADCSALACGHGGTVCEAGETCCWWGCAFMTSC